MNDMRGILVLGHGEHRIEAPLDIGSVRVVSRRDFIVVPTLPAFYNNVLRALVRNVLKKFGVA